MTWVLVVVRCRPMLPVVGARSSRARGSSSIVDQILTNRKLISADATSCSTSRLTLQNWIADGVLRVQPRAVDVLLLMTRIPGDGEMAPTNTEIPTR